MSVGGVLAITLLTESEVVTLRAIEVEMALLDWLETLRLITDKPHIVTLILVALV
jgi:hypothetical protein